MQQGEERNLPNNILGKISSNKTALAFSPASDEIHKKDCDPRNPPRSSSIFMKGLPESFFSNDVHLGLSHQCFKLEDDGNVGNAPELPPEYVNRTF